MAFEKVALMSAASGKAVHSLLLSLCFFLFKLIHLFGKVLGGDKLN